MTLPRLYSLNARLRRNPPLQAMVQAYLGIKTEPQKPAGHTNTDDDLEEFMKAFTGLGGKVG